MNCFKPYFFFFLPVFLSALIPLAAAAQAMQVNQLKDSLKQALGHEKDDTSRAKTLFLLGNSYAATDSSTAIQYAVEGRNLSEQHNWQKGMGNYYLLLAKLYRSVSDNNACLQNARKAYLIFNNTTEKKSSAAALVYMANSYQATGFFAKSIENNLAALPVYESINNSHGISLCDNNIGVDYYDLRQYDKAIEYYNKALDLRKKEDDKFGIGSDLDNIALVYLAKENYDSANAYNQEAIKMFEASNDQPGLGRIYANRGNILIKMHDAKSAYEYYRKSLAIDTKLGIEDGLSYSYGFIGEIYLDLAKDTSAVYKIASFMKKDKRTLLDSAEFYGTQALAWAHKAGDISLLMYHSLLISEIEERLGHFQNALTSQKEYAKYKDSIYNDENKQKIEAMESERLTQTKDQEIVLQVAEARRQALLKKVVLIVAMIVLAFICLLVLLYNRRKKAGFDKEVMEVEMKALRAQMNPHFISNALHSINKYVMENDKKNASGYLGKFASLMRLILENSREREVTLELDLKALNLYMEMEQLRFNNNFTYHIEVDPKIDPENTLVPPMLLQPFAENAILHGLRNKENGVISIQVNKLNDMIRFVIADNGSSHMDIASSAVTDGEKHKSLGKKMINERLSIINRLKKAKATVNIFQLKDADNRPEGVRVELLLPVELVF
jgi:tetratricopeptide (TPR) repeat protein